MNVQKVYDTDPDYCPDPDTYHLGIPGFYRLVVDKLYRAIRIKTDEEWLIRGYSADEVKQQINGNLGEVRNPVPF